MDISCVAEISPDNDSQNQKIFQIKMMNIVQNTKSGLDAWLASFVAQSATIDTTMSSSFVNDLHLQHALVHLDNVMCMQLKKIAFLCNVRKRDMRAAVSRFEWMG